jgi:hypothetical protein
MIARARSSPKAKQPEISAKYALVKANSAEFILGAYDAGQLRTLQCWRHEPVKRLICEMQDFTQDVGSGTG